MISELDLDKLNSICIVMELVDIDLSKLFERRSMIFSEKVLIKIVYNSLCSLAFLHEANVIHRDIKPSNILIGGDFNVKICDLGFSRNTV